MRTCACALLTALVCIGCGQAADPEEGRGTAETEPTSPPGEIHWGYAGEVGPEHWADLRPDYSLCRDGVEQSPIDLAGAEPVQETSTERLFGDATATLQRRARVMDLIDNGHTVQVTTDVQMPLELNGVHYELAQFHFHAPSEHTIDGVHAPLEVHLVHQSADSELAVIGVLVEEGEHDESWDPIIAALPEGAGDERHLDDLDFDMNALRPPPRRYYRYRGSLTTPPCSEGVEWIVMAETRQMSPEQMTALVSHLHHNNRPVQPLDDRTIELVSR